MLGRLVIFCLLLLVATRAEAPSKKFKCLLFYTCVTKEVHNQCEESFTLDQAGIVNTGTTNNFTTINLGYQKGIASLFAIHDTFFVNGHGMRADWKQRWAKLKIQLVPLIEAKKVVGFFIGDELFPGKISVQNFTTALDAVGELKSKYPWLYTWENEGGTGWIKVFKGKGIPAGLDVISIDDYYLSVDQHREFYEKEIYPLLSSHQSVFLVPGAYGTRHNISKSPWCGGGNTLEDCDKFMVKRTQDYFQWAVADPRVTGFAPWHWDTRQPDEVSAYKEVGVVDMPLLKAEWKAIGKHVVPH